MSPDRWRWLRNCGGDPEPEEPLEDCPHPEMPKAMQLPNRMVDGRFAIWTRLRDKIETNVC
jgi:hypothetical protein